MIGLLVTLVVICVVGYLLWLLLQMIPIPNPQLRQIVNILFVLILVLAVIFEVLLPLAHIGSRW